jgi:hypothetical protein
MTGPTPGWSDTARFCRGDSPDGRPCSRTCRIGETAGRANAPLANPRTNARGNARSEKRRRRATRWCVRGSDVTWGDSFREGAVSIKLWLNGPASGACPDVGEQGAVEPENGTPTAMKPA